MMRVHPKGLLVAALFAIVVALATDARVGVAALVAAVVLDWLSLALPLGLARHPRAHRK